MSESDVVIVGAGLSAIDVAFRLHERCPELAYEILEARDAIGGTWDLFRYPGARSDSDIHTLAFPFRPWPGEYSIVDAEAIRDYVLDTARITGIADHVRFGHRVRTAAWDSASARWTLRGDGPDGPFERTCRFVVFCTGYYSYDHPHDPGFTGRFEGPVVHPQHWPQDLDVHGRRVAVIGSGATAMTLVPALARLGAQVTMVQRTPTYVLAQPRTDAVGRVLDAVLPRKAAYRAVRAKNTAAQWALVTACRRFPRAMRSVLQHGVASATSPEIAAKHFTPPYDPWDQRLCIVPEGDLFEAINDGTATVVTGTTTGFVPDGVALQDGRVVPADIIVTATGLRLELVGGIELVVDGEPFDLPRSFTYYGTMFSGLPNAAACIGYINLSWTVRADLTARLIGRVVRRLLDSGSAYVVPQAPDLGEGRPFMDMESGYLVRAAHLMPRTSDSYPWAISQDVRVDARETNRADLDVLTWVR